MNLNVNQIIGQVTTIAHAFVKLAILAILAVLTARYLRLSYPFVIPPTPTEAAYLCGAWWLWSKA